MVNILGGDLRLRSVQGGHEVGDENSGEDDRRLDATVAVLV